MKSKTYAALQEAVDLILWEQWDPIDVNDASQRDEYSSYVSDVLKLLQSGADIITLAEHLEEMERTTMGLRGDHENCRWVAQQLLDEYRRHA